MKKLLIVRHAKSDWSNPNLRDFERTLNQKGLTDALEMAKRLKKRNILPDQIVSSPAVRALNTCEIICKELEIQENKIELNKTIYEASHKTLLQIINNFDDNHDFIALFGHNNGITDLIDYLTNADIFDVPTCGMALVEFPFDNWSMISRDTGSVLFYDYPKLES